MIVTQCPRCGGTFPPEALSSRRGYKCRECINAYHREWRTQNRVRHRATVKKYRTSPKGLKTRQARHLKTKFGLTADEFDLMLNAQANSCAICDREFANGVCPCVDHDHATDEVRALLCRACNASLGGFQDNPQLLRIAADYLESHEARSDQHLRRAD